MATKNSYCDVVVTRAKKIILTIDLSKKESTKKKSVTKVVPLSPPKTLYEITQRHIDDISSKITHKIDEQRELGCSKTARKLAKKIIKCKKIRLSEVAAELGVSKNNLKSWLVKGEHEEADNKDYEELLKSWVMSVGQDISTEDIYDIISRYTKSLYKSLHKASAQSSQAPKSIQMEAVVMDSTFPKRRLQYEGDSQGEEQGPSDQNLTLVQINVRDSGIHIKDTVMWDSEDLDSELILQFADGIVKDYLAERALVLPAQKIDGLVRKIQEQISRQVETSNDLKGQTEVLATFNGNHTAYKQKECVIKISISIKEEGYHVEDVFDWEVDPLLNKPEVFAEQYVRDNRLPDKFKTLISSQIRTQLSNYLQKRLTSFLKLYEPKLGPIEESETVEGKKKINNKIKENIIYSLGENMESFPTDLAPYKSGQFLKNAELYALTKKYSDFLTPSKKKIFQRQKAVLEQSHSKKVAKVVEPKKAPSTPPSSDHESTSRLDANGKPHNLRPRSFNKNYRVFAGDLINPPPPSDEMVPEQQQAKYQANMTLKGPTLSNEQIGYMYENHVPSKASLGLENSRNSALGAQNQRRAPSSQGRHTSSIYRTHGKKI